MWVVTRSSIWNFWARSSLLRCHFQGKSVPVSRIFLFQASHHCWGVSPRNDVWQVCGTSAEIFPDTYEQLRSSSGGMGRDPFNQTFPEFSVQNSMDRFGPSGKVSKKRVHLLRWSSFPGRTGWNFGWMDRAHGFHASAKAILYRVSTISLVIPRILSIPYPATDAHFFTLVRLEDSQESLQRTSAKNKQQHSWVSFGPTFQLHWPQYFWCPGAWHGVALCSGTNIQRKQREMRLTFQLGTVQPKGLNINFSFIWIGTLCSSCARYHTTSSPVLFPQKKGWGGKRAFSRPTHFLREKPWGRGWLLYARVHRSFLCCIWNCIVLYNGFFSQWRRIINPKRLCFLKTFDTFWSVFFRECHLIS